MKRTLGVVCVAVAAMSAAGQPVASRVTSNSDQGLLTALVAVEDARVISLSQADPRRHGVASKNAYLRAFTLRGLGRLESPSVIPLIALSLVDSVAAVRVAAADAVAQAAARAVPANADGPARAASLSAAESARTQLVPRLYAERDPAVRAALLEAIGRLNQGSVNQVKATANIIASSFSVSSIVERRGAIRGMFFLARKREARVSGVIPVDVTDRMFAMLAAPASAGYTPTDRYNIAFALVGAAALNDARMTAVFADSDPYVRDRAVAALPRATDTGTVRLIVRRAMADPAPVVRFRSVAVYTQRLRAVDGCEPLIGLTRDSNMHVALAAMDALSGCRSDGGTTARFLDSVASGFRDDDRWHLPAHAFVSLSAVDPVRARALMPKYMMAQGFFARMYADTAARLMGDAPTLYFLAGDVHPNVRASAIDGLSKLVGHAADSAYLKALESDDNQLLMSASAALKGSPADGVRSAAVVTWTRLRELRRETTHDGEEALIELIRGFGAFGDIVGGSPRDEKPLPTFANLATIERTVATIEMADGRIITMRFHPFDAPTNAARFVRLARAGTFDGLTFHRVAPFFVVQGPGPYANEYSAPDGPFARDELAVSNVRGTVGLSTRGRDTGDGQIYINTVDNIWLDHDYTVIATIVTGLEAFDRMQEGARIRRITVALAAPRSGR